MFITTTPYSADDVSQLILHSLISKGIQMEEATTIIGRGNTALRLWTQDRDEVNRLIEDYTDAIARLKRYAGDAQLSYAMFLSMADSIARTI